jgi:hypothetical protein
MKEADDPRTVCSIAVTAGDVVAAHEANRGAGLRTVLRVTPPFSGRMRARLHRIVDDEGGDEAGAVHVAPAELLTADAPSFPHPDETEDELRADPEVAYSRERHRQRHEAAVDEWRSRATEYVAGTVTLETPDGPHEVEVRVLG